jgi:hypothetical protein
MPQPLSSIVRLSAPETCLARTRIRPLAPVNFTALESRFMTICFIARRSAITFIVSGIFVSTLMDFAAA